MIENHPWTASDHEAAFMDQLAEFTSCVDRATFAISTNDLGMLEEALGQQQALCAELNRTLRFVIGQDPSHLPRRIQAEVRRVTDRNRTFLLLLQQVALHARSLQRLHGAKLEERWASDRRPVRAMEGRYV